VFIVFLIAAYLTLCLFVLMCFCRVKLCIGSLAFVVKSTASSTKVLYSSAFCAAVAPFMRLVEVDFIASNCKCPYVSAGQFRLLLEAAFAPAVCIAHLAALGPKC